MSFLRAARAALAGQSGLPWILVAMVIVLAGLSLSCGNSYSPSVPNHNAYVTLPSQGSVLLLDIDGATGAITLGTSTPQVENTTPTGLALLPSKNLLYAANSRANTISIFNVASDGTLTLSGPPTTAGFGPNVAILDPSGQYLLVTNSYGNNISVYSIDAGSGALTEVAGSPFSTDLDPGEILFTHSGKFVYVANLGTGTVSAFSFSNLNGALTELPGSPFPSASSGGAAALAVDVSDSFLYVTNPSAPNIPPYQNTTGNISGFNIASNLDPNPGALTPISGSPFTSLTGSGPTAIAVDPTGKFVYAVTSGSSSSIWCFTINFTNGPASGQLTPVASSPFSLSAGGLFAFFDPAGYFFYIGSPTGIAGYSYNQNTGALKAIAGSPFSTGAAPGLMVISE